MTKQPKERVDILLVERGLCETREKQNGPLWQALSFQMKYELIRQARKLPSMHRYK